ncbi:MAG: glycoside hydrolase family 92 protein, partial [Bacteroidia bacterium]|nr:glycoside hydrolase family 92 protein [Bacteroidia bacterium]
HRDMLLKHAINVDSKNSVSGKRISKAWANEQHVYFYAEFSKPFKSVEFNNADSTKAAFTFDVNEGDSIILKVGISAVDEHGAKNNLLAEAPHWSMLKYYDNATRKWNKALGKMNGEFLNIDDEIIFNTALYHNMIAPNTFSDVDGRYRGMDMKIHQDTTQKTYTVFSLWDTFRATHPLYTIIEQKRTNEFINTFLKQFKQSGLLPVWELAGNETNCMIGFHSASVIADAYVKNIRDYNVNEALDAMLVSAGDKEKRFTTPNKNYVQAQFKAESVSKTLEYAYDHWCIQLMKDSLNKFQDLQSQRNHLFAYRNLFDKETGFMRPRKNGGWFGSFDPTEVNFHFTEANSWQYSMFVPHNISDLIALHGGDEAFEKKLDELFNSSSEMGGRHQSDITGLIGQYAHGNEPSHHMAYLYNYVGKPWKTQAMVRRIMDEMYSNAPDGLSGNEDCGQMSAWYVFSAMGFYPVTPGLPYYTIGSPLVKEMNINLENGNVFKIVANNNSDKNIYVQSVTLNGETYPYSFINHTNIMNGGELVFEMGGIPNKSWGVKEEYRPVSVVNRDYLSLPVIQSASQTFEDSLKVEISHFNPEVKLEYIIDGTGKQLKAKVFEYDKPFYVRKSCSITAMATVPGKKLFSKETAEFYKIKKDKKITLNSTYANQYAAAGNDALIDQLRGGMNFRTGDWQGYQGQDMEAIIAFDEMKQINKISLSCLQDIQSWIWYPKNVSFYSSTDGVQWTLIEKVNNKFADDAYGAFTQELSLNTKMKTKFIKVVAENYGVCPEWHLGNGGNAWIFVDEIIID